MMNIEGDSAEYEYIAQGVELSKDVEGLCIELGLRRAMGTKVIIDSIKEFCPDKSAIAIDPYGSILYEGREGQICRLDYTNTMKNETMQAIHAYAELNGVHFIPIILEDTEFFNRYADGIPIYKHVKVLESKYSFAHLDATHTVSAVKLEIDFFNDRMMSGACIVCDDVTIDFYDHDGQVEPYLFKLGFELVIKGGKKALYQKK